MKPRPHNLVVPVTREELAQLHAIAHHEDRSLSATVRDWIGTRYRRVFGDAPAPDAHIRTGARTAKEGRS